MDLRGLLLAGLLTATLSGAFEPPSATERTAALGQAEDLPATWRPLFEPDGDFRPLLPPGPRDWLAVHQESGQTVEAYRASGANRPDAARRIIYLQPIGDFPEATAPELELMRIYAAAYYQMEVKLLRAYHPHDLEFSPRQNRRSGQRQILTTDIMGFLKTHLPDDGYCLLGITMEDLYPRPTWNYVFGEASLDQRVGIFSFARYDPAFWGDERGRHYRDLILQRGCKVLVHETAHMFGLPHCIYYECVMNGSNHLAETDRKPQQLCPVCLRKLHQAIGFDPAVRYRQLGKLYRGWQWFDELDFTDRQLARLVPSPVNPPAVAR